MDWIEVWMNDRANKKALGVDPNREFENCNMKVNQDFFLQGDSSHNSAALLPELVDDGMRLLVYAGKAGEFGESFFVIFANSFEKDMMCNFIVCPYS
jgi:Serine carboxypeptidase